MTMEKTLKEEQIEALETYLEYNMKLLNSMHMLLKELRGERREDTDEFQKKIIEGINWEVGVLNGTLSLINQSEKLIDKEEVNACILKLDFALKTKEDLKIADVVEQDIIPEFDKISAIIKVFLNKENNIN